MTSMHQAENPSHSPMLLTFEQKTLSHVVNPGEGPLLHESHMYGSAGDRYTAALRVGWGGAWVGGCIHRQQARKSGGEMEPPSPSTGKLAPVKSACEERL